MRLFFGGFFCCFLIVDFSTKHITYTPHFYALEMACSLKNKVIVRLAQAFTCHLTTKKSVFVHSYYFSKW